VAWQGGRKMRRRSSVEIPPIGSPVSGWGKHDSLIEILARPTPALPIYQGQNKTMAMHGGRWSLYKPATQLYWESRRSMQTPGPGTYGDPVPDAVLSNAPVPFGKLKSGAFMRCERKTEVDAAQARARRIPGPGQYDTEHMYGIHERIKAAIPESPPRPHTRIGLSPISTHDDVFGQQAGQSWESGDGMMPGTWDTIASEQCLVMSMKVPVQKHQRLAVTCFSRLRKDKVAPAVRKIHNRSPTRSPSPFARVPRPDAERIHHDEDEDDAMLEASWPMAQPMPELPPELKCAGTVMF